MKETGQSQWHSEEECMSDVPMQLHVQVFHFTAWFALNNCWQKFQSLMSSPHNINYQQHTHRCVFTPAPGIIDQY